MEVALRACYMLQLKTKNAMEAMFLSHYNKMKNFCRRTSKHHPCKLVSVGTVFLEENLFSYIS